MTEPGRCNVISECWQLADPASSPGQAATAPAAAASPAASGATAASGAAAASAAAASAATTSAAATSAASLRNLYAGVYAAAVLSIEDVERRKADVRELFLAESDFVTLQGVQRRHVRRRSSGCRSGGAASEGQQPRGAQHRYGLRTPLPFRSRFSLRHGATSHSSLRASLDQPIARNTTIVRLRRMSGKEHRCCPYRCASKVCPTRFVGNVSDYSSCANDRSH